MPTRSRAGRSSTTVEEPEEEQSQTSTSRLKFNEALSWRAGKPIALADLLRRLQALSGELRDLDQEEDDREAFAKVAKELASPALLGHKDKGVRAWTACCLVDILRLCAPDAPFSGSQLKEIFKLFIEGIVPALAETSNAYNTQHVYVVASLAQVKSIVLLTDLPSPDMLILNLFASCFDILSTSIQSSTEEQIGKHVEHHMTEILVILVDEATSLPADAVDIIIAQFLRADSASVGPGSRGKNKSAPTIDEKQSTLVLRELPPAYNMAKTICVSCPEKMARYISQYFNDVIMDASTSGPSTGPKSHRRSTLTKEDWESDEGADGPSSEDIEELRKAHSLLQELWRASPAVLQNVIPQLETELNAENVQLRLLATETLSNIVAGIGAAGLPPVSQMDPAAFPQAKLSDAPDNFNSNNVLTLPASPQAFSQAHPSAYNSLMGRGRDKSPLIRAAWTTGLGKIITTSAGGVGLNAQEEKGLVANLAEKLADSDERVRIAAIKAVAAFGLRDVVMKLGPSGDVYEEGSILSNLADRGKDRKHPVRVEAMKTLGRLWGVGSGEIMAEQDAVTSVLGSIPSRIFDAFYVNDQDIYATIDQVTYDMLLPISYPPSKSKAKSDRVNSQSNGDHDSASSDPDTLRAERFLLLAKGLDERGRKAFNAMLARQSQWSKVFEVFLKRCSEYNGGVMDENESAIKDALNRLIDWFSKNLPDPLRISGDLWKFAKMNDRRTYQLLRFMMNPDSDYKTVVKALREITKRFNEAGGSSSSAVLESLMLIIYRIGLFTYNKSHVPTIVNISRTDAHGLGTTAHEYLKEISTHNPEIFKAHVKELCGSLEDHTPTAKKKNEAGDVDTLKACASFAQKFPKEIPKERKFMQTLVSFAQYGSPPAAAKHAVTILLAASDKKEMHAKELVQKSLKGFKFGGDHFLTRLATLSQLVLLAPSETQDQDDAIVDLVLEEILGKVRKASKNGEEDWTTDENLDDECTAKIWALKILINRLRARPAAADAKELAGRVYKLLHTLIVNEGELSKSNNTPASHKSRLRLAAAQLLLRLCKIKSYDDELSPIYFNQLALVAQDKLANVRQAFVNKLKKYLGQSRLPARFYTVIFLLAFEPDAAFKSNTLTWIRSRANTFAAHKSTAMEVILARLLSLLAHHPDYASTSTDLTDFAQFIIYYLEPVAREENLGLIYHVAQRVKQVRDALDSKKSDNLYTLSDLTQAIIRQWEDLHGWSMQTWPGKLKLPSSLFAGLPSHEVAQEIATKTYLPDELEESLDRVVKSAVRSKAKKRKSEAPGDDGPKKRTKGPGTAAKSKPLPIRKSSKPKTPKKPKLVEIPSSERRTSGRVTNKEVTYAESSDEDDDGMDVEEEEEDESE